MAPKVIRVGIADLKVTRPPNILKSPVLGSCVGVVLYDPKTKVGGLAHVLLPSHNEAKADDNPAKFADTAVAEMVSVMLRKGAKKDWLVAKIVGGACMFASPNSRTGMDIGTRNAEAIRLSLQSERIRLVADDTGGSYGRSVELDTSTGRTIVRSIARGVREI